MATSIKFTDAGEHATYGFTLDNVASGTVTVQIPTGVSTRIDVWIR